MNSVDKYALIPFNKYQKLLKSSNTKEPLGSAKDSHNTTTFHISQSRAPYVQIGRGVEQTSSPDKDEKKTINSDVNAASSKITMQPPPGIPVGEVNKTANKGWLSYWEEL